jgi:hypothetical protein
MRLVGGNPMERPLEAQVIDSRHLKLKNPIQIPPGSKIMITIEPADAIAEDQAWYALSAQTLLAAYGDDEPDYSLEM